MEYEKVWLEADQACEIVVEYRQWESEYPNMKLL